MTATVTEARDDIVALVRTCWVTTLGLPEASLIYQDKPGDVPKDKDASHNPKPWARVTVQNATGQQSGLANGAYSGSRRKYTNGGFLTVQVFTPGGLGLTTSDAITQALKRAFGVSTAHGVWFRNPRVNEVGPDGSWYQVNFLVDFVYDDVA